MLHQHSSSRSHSDRNRTLLRTTLVSLIAALSISASARPDGKGLIPPGCDIQLTWPAEGDHVDLGVLEKNPLRWIGCGAVLYEVELTTPSGEVERAHTSRTQWNFFKPAQGDPECPLSGCDPDPTAVSAPAAGLKMAGSLPAYEKSGWYTWRVRDCFGDCSAVPWTEGSFLATAGSLVEVQGDKFVLDGSPYRFIGVNMPNAHWRDTRTIREQLRAASGMAAEVVRIRLFKTHQTVDAIGDQLWDYLQEMSSINPRMRVIVAFANLYGFQENRLTGDSCSYKWNENIPDWVLEKAWFSQHCPSDRLCDLGDVAFPCNNYVNTDSLNADLEPIAKPSYKEAVEVIVTRFAGDSRIFAWELGNEFRAENPSLMEAFTRDMVELIKDKNEDEGAGAAQLVTGGFLSSHHALNDYNNQFEIERLYRGENALDFMTVHGYDLSWRTPGIPPDGGGYHYVDIDYRWARYRIPYVVEELGFTGAFAPGNDGCGDPVFPGGSWDGVEIPPAGDDRSEATAAAVRHFFDGYLADGVMQWGFMEGIVDTRDGDHCSGLTRLHHLDFDPLYCEYQRIAQEQGAPCPPPSVPSPVDPVDGSTVSGDDSFFRFRWADGAPRAIDFTLQVDDHPSWLTPLAEVVQEPIRRDSSLAAYRAVPLDLDCGRTYYWRVLHHNCCGQTSTSPTWTFVTSCNPVGADLGVAVEVSDSTPTVGEEILNTITIENHGPEPASGIVVGTGTESTPPGGLALVASTVTQGTYNPATGEWSVGSLSAGGAAQLRLTVAVVLAGEHTTTVHRLASQPADPAASNDSASVHVTSNPPPPDEADIALTLSVDDADPALGDRIAYRAVAVNEGPTGAGGVTIGTETDSSPPGGLRYVSHQTSRGSYAPSDGLWAVGDLASGDLATLDLVVDVIGSGTHTTTATRLASTPTDPDGSNDAASVVVSSFPVGCAAPPGGQELVANGSFSDGLDLWHLTPPPQGSTADVGVESCCASPPGGYPNAFAHPNGAGGTLGLWQEIPDAQAGDYRLSAWIRTSGLADGVPVEGYVQADDGDPDSIYCRSEVVNPTAWALVECCFSLTQPAPLHVAISGLNTTSWEASSAWLAWDDVSLVGPAPPPAPPIAFSSYRSGPPNLFVMEADGSGMVQLTSEGFFGSPEWSPDAREIAFTSTGFEIQVIGAAGGPVRTVTEVDEILDYSPTWSPDGSRIAHVSEWMLEDGEYESEIYATGVNDGVTTRITDNDLAEYDPAWSPDGSRIAFAGRSGASGDIYVVDSDGSNETRLTFDGSSGQPSWSPDSLEILFTSSRDGNTEIYVMNADGSDVRRLTDHPAWDDFASWSPLGDRIVFASRRGGYYWSLYVMDVDGGNVLELTDQENHDLSPAWAPVGIGGGAP